MSVFSSVKAAPPIEVFQLGRDFAADTNPKKVQCVQWVYCVQCVQCEVYDFKTKGEPWSGRLPHSRGQTVDPAGR